MFQGNVTLSPSVTLRGVGFGRRPLLPALAPLFVRGKDQSCLILP
jgi:hypothetical protein